MNIHLERLFKETQRPQVPELEKIIRRSDKYEKRQSNLEREDFETELRTYSNQLAKNAAGISNSGVFEKKVTEELDTLMGRFKIYGI